MMRFGVCFTDVLRSKETVYMLHKWNTKQLTALYKQFQQHAQF